MRTIGLIVMSTPRAMSTPPATTEHPVNEPGFELRKSADPASGTRVDPGSVITYTVTGVNTGETALDPVSINDDLSGVLDHAANVRSVLDGWAPTSPTWHLVPLTLWDSQQAQPDLAVKLPVTGRHPYYAVDLYELRGEPKEA